MSKLVTSFAVHNASASIHLLQELDLKLPFWRCHGIFRSSAYSFLLDSAKDPHKLGRFSFLGGDPFLVYRAKRIRRAASVLEANIEVLELASPEGKRFRDPILKKASGKSI